MKPIAALLLIVSAAGLVACGKSEEAAAPAPEPAVAEAPAAEAPAAPPADADAPASEAVADTAPSAPPAPVATPAVKAPVPAAPAPAAPPPAPAAPAVADLVHGQKIYRQACAFCHDKGVAGAPRTGDAAAWSARIAQGMDTLYAVALKGKGAMPARGGNPSLSDADVHAAVDFMVAQAR